MADIIPAPKGELSFERILATAMRAPGVKINRAKFLKKELMKYYAENTVEEAIRRNPAKAGVSKEIVNKISVQVINYETTKVTALSAAASLPGGVYAVGAAAADITSYFVFILRAVQKLAYLYGFEEFDLDVSGADSEIMDSETMNYLLVFMGVMFKVQGAETALRKFADTLTKHVTKKLAQKALTKGTIYPMVKKVAAAVGVRMTKQIFADGVASAIPLLGSLASGGLTYAAFRPGCMRLRESLMSYNLCDPAFFGVIEVDAFTVEDA